MQSLLTGRWFSPERGYVRFAKFASPQRLTVSSARADPVGGHVRRHALDALDVEAFLALDLEPVLVEQLERTVRHQQLVAGSLLGHARRDVHVHAEVVAAELPRPPHVQAGAEAGPVAGSLDLVQLL